MPRERALVVVGVLLVLLVGGWWLLTGEDSPTSPEPSDAADGLEVTWGESPACVYDAATSEIQVTLEATGEGDPVTATVTAYADEDTSQPVGSGSTTVDVAGTVTLGFVVEEEPYVDIDGVAACSIDVE